MSVKLETYLRIRPLDAKHRLKIKHDYYKIYPKGLPAELKQSDMPRSLLDSKKMVLAVQGHPQAGGA